MEHQPVVEYVVLAAAGFVAALVNVIAGGGSLLTLPVLLWVGLPAPVANASNRIGLVLQNISAATAFHRGGRLPWKPTLLLFLPALPGALLGAEVAVDIDELLFRRILVGVLLCSLWGLLRRPGSSPTPPRPAHPLVTAGTFFAIGFYAGFLQAGLGLLLLTLLYRVGGFDLVRSNAIKVTFVLLLQLVVLVVFGRHGQLDWGAGAALGAGTMVGAWVSARWQMRRGPEWVRRAVVGVLLLFAMRLAWEGFVR